MVLRHLLLLSNSLTWASITFARAAAGQGGEAVQQQVGGGANHQHHHHRRQLQPASSTTLSMNEVCGNEGLSALEEYSTAAFLAFFGNITVEITTESGGFNCGCMYESDNNNNNNDQAAAAVINSLIVVCNMVYNSGENASIVSTNREFLTLASSLVLLPADDNDPEDNNNTEVERYIPTRSGWADVTGMVGWSETYDFNLEAAIENAVLQFESCEVDNEYCNQGGSECTVCDENNQTTVAVSSACDDFETPCEADYQGSYMNEYFFENNIVSVLADERFECGGGGDDNDVDDSVPTQDEFCGNLANIETTLYDAYTAYANNTRPNEEFSCRCINDDVDENQEGAGASSVGRGFTVMCGTTWTTTDPEDEQEELIFTYTETMEFELRGDYLVPERMSWCNTPSDVQVPICTDYQFCLGQESLCSCSRVGCDTDYCELCSDGASVGYMCPRDLEPVLCSANVVGAFSFAFRSLRIAPDCTIPGPSVSPTLTGLPTSTPLVGGSETPAPSNMTTNAPTPETDGSSSIIASDMPSESPFAAETTVAPVVPTDTSTTPSPTLTPDKEVIPLSSGISAAWNGMLMTAVMYVGVTLAML